jgi:predicted enzyme related to lactoylglutathione lyase
MIDSVTKMMVYVLDQDSAKRFYTEKLGFEVRTDVMLREDSEGEGGGLRWLTVGPPEQPDFELILADCDMDNDVETADQMRSLVAKGAMSAGVLETDDCRAAFAELSSRGVTFLEKPAERPYGIEAVLRDDSGNWFSLTQPHR